MKSSFTIDIILKRIYDKHEITTNFGRKEMKDLITLCTKSVPFTFNNEILIDSLAMGSPLGLVLAGIIMVELENSIVPKLNSHLKFWKRYVDDALTIVKEGSINHVLQQFNSFHPSIQFTFETESSGRIPFLDILIIKKTSKIKRTVYRKSIDTGIYLNSFSFAPNTWKRGTLKNLVHRAYSICSTEYLKKELIHLEKIFIFKNDYPRWVIKQILTQMEKQQERSNMNNSNNDDSNTNNQNSFSNENNKLMSERQLSFITLPYKVQQGETR